MSSASAGRRRRASRPPGSAPDIKRYLRTADPDRVSAAIAGGGYEGIALGAEFCSLRLPTFDETLSVLAQCRKAGMELALVTPVVRQAALPTVIRLMEQVAGAAAGLECVVNDWGVLQWAMDSGLDLRCTAGRLLSKQRRDPSVLTLLQQASPKEARILRGSVWDDPANVELLVRMGVKRIELDFLLQGATRPNLPPDIALAVCAPWLPVTFSPECLWSPDPLACSRECLVHDTVKQQGEIGALPLWSRGNALFVRSDIDPPYRALSILGANRLVWAEELPA